MDDKGPYSHFLTKCELSVEPPNRDTLKGQDATYILLIFS